MEADLVVREDVVIPGRELVVSASRAGGPGGQHVNKTNSKVTLRWNFRDSIALTHEQKLLLANKLGDSHELVVQVDTERSQYRNRQLARERLADAVRMALHKPKKRFATKPKKGAIERRVANKKARSTLKQQRARLDD